MTAATAATPATKTAITSRQQVRASRPQHPARRAPPAGRRILCDDLPALLSRYACAEPGICDAGPCPRRLPYDTGARAARKESGGIESGGTDLGAHRWSVPNRAAKPMGRRSRRRKIPDPTWTGSGCAALANSLKAQPH
jgi:hypothetical protein